MMAVMYELLFYSPLCFTTLPILLYNLELTSITMIIVFTQNLDFVIMSYPSGLKAVRVYKAPGSIQTYLFTFSCVSTRIPFVRLKSTIYPLTPYRFSYSEL